MKKALIKPKKKHITFMFVPESESTVISYRVPSWAPRAAVFTVALLILLSVVSVSSLTAMRTKYESNSHNIERLTQINASQKSQIENLKTSSDKMQKQLDENSKLLEEVKSAVGIKSDSASGSEKKNNNSALNSLEKDNVKMTILSLLSKNEAKSYDSGADIKYISASFDAISKQIAEQKQEIEESQKPISGKLVYLKALPSIKPVVAAITCGFGYRSNPFTSRGSEFHKGIDFGASYGSTVVATGDGIVTFAGRYAGYGKMVIISHGYNITTCYGHNSKLLVKQGDKIKKGQPIAKVGSTGRSTGAHLHYEVRLNGKSVNPAKYFK